MQMPSINKQEEEHNHIVMELIITQELQNSYPYNSTYFWLNGKIGQFKTL
jgi:hypothetical protein